MIGEFGAAVMLLTRVPAGWLVRSAPDPARCLWAYPIVGAGIGLCGAAVFALARRLGMSAGLSAVWTLAATAWLTGALHEDGLADVADGFGGGRTVERKLDIMRDSRVGSYGVLALVLATAIRGVALSQIASPALALVAASALSRGSMAVPVMLLPAARRDGLGATVAGARGPICCVLALAACALAPRPVVTAAVAVAAALAVTGLARRQIGGFTGDVLGATSVVVECAVLTVAACT